MSLSKRAGQLEGGNQTKQRHSLLLDVNLSIKAASPSFCSVFHFTPGELLGTKLADLGNGQWNNPALLRMLRGLPEKEGEFDDFEMKCDFPLVGLRTVLLSGQRVPSLDDRQAGMILLSLEDAGPEKVSETNSAQPLLQFRSALASVGDAVIVTDPAARILFMNAAAERLTGWRTEDALNRFLPDVMNVVSEQSVKLESPVERAIKAGGAVGFAEHAILIARDGSEWPIDDSAAPMLDPAGHITGVVVVFRDISKRRKAEQALAFSEARYRRLFESAHDGV
jgi:PAS domain S-box-containing protein